jgi:membrane protein YqaA with SNARE-associated domain
MRWLLHSVLGAMLGYAIGYLLFERRFGDHFLLRLWRKGSGAARPVCRAGIWIIFIKGLTPIPFKLVTIVSGAMAFNIRSSSRHAQ